MIGAGLIGHSVSLAARRAHPEIEITEIDRGESLLAAVGADVIVLATPVDVIQRLVQSEPEVFRNSLTIDVGSVKVPIMKAAARMELRSFVGGHPMAGAATSGPSGARADLFDGRTWFLVPHTATADAARRARDFVSELGAAVVVLEDDGSEHDRVMAAVSHLPQVIASLLIDVVASAAGERLAWAGPGLRDTTRLADSSAATWESILVANSEQLRPLLFTLADQVAQLAQQLDDPRSIRDLFDRARQARSRLQ